MSLVREEFEKNLCIWEGTHPTGMYTCFKRNNSPKVQLKMYHWILCEHKIKYLYIYIVVQFQDTYCKKEVKRKS